MEKNTNIPPALLNKCCRILYNEKRDTFWFVSHLRTMTSNVHAYTSSGKQRVFIKFDSLVECMELDKDGNAYIITSAACTIYNNQGQYVSMIGMVETWGWVVEMTIHEQQGNVLVVCGTRRFSAYDIDGESETRHIPTQSTTNTMDGICTNSRGDVITRGSKLIECFDVNYTPLFSIKNEIGGLYGLFVDTSDRLVYYTYSRIGIREGDWKAVKEAELEDLTYGKCTVTDDCFYRIDKGGMCIWKLKLDKDSI